MWLAFGTQTRELRDGEIVVGSGADADWRVPTADLMPRHFTLLIHGLNASLRPTSKDNVVVVNGRQISTTPQLLNDGDVICAGSGRFFFTDDAPRIESPETPDPGSAYLVDEGAKLAHRLVSRSTTIGRDGSNTIVLRDPAASRFHAEVRREAGGYALHSMGSGGTLLNQKRLDAPTMLEDGCTIEIAYGRLRFVRSIPPGVSLAPVHEVTSTPAQRNPTLSTGKISVVPASRGWSVGKMMLGALLIALVALAFVLAR